MRHEVQVLQSIRPLSTGPENLISSVCGPADYADTKSINHGNEHVRVSGVPIGFKKRWRFGI